MKWIHFRITGPLRGESTGQRWFVSQRPVMRSVDIVFDARLDKWLYKQWKSWWFGTPWCSCDVIVMFYFIKSFVINEISRIEFKEFAVEILTIHFKQSSWNLRLQGCCRRGPGRRWFQMMCFVLLSNSSPSSCSIGIIDYIVMHHICISMINIG